MTTIQEFFKELRNLPCPYRDEDDDKICYNDLSDNLCDVNYCFVVEAMEVYISWKRKTAAVTTTVKEFYEELKYLPCPYGDENDDGELICSSEIIIECNIEDCPVVEAMKRYLPWKRKQKKNIIKNI